MHFISMFKTLMLTLLFLPLAWAKAPANFYPTHLMRMAPTELRQELQGRTSREHQLHSYQSAREKMFGEIYLRKDSRGQYIEEVYCDDKFYVSKVKIPDPKVMNCEHTWPQSKFNSRLSIHHQKADLHHLFPTYSKINSERGSLPFAEVDRARNLSCQVSQLGSSLRSGKGLYFEPPDDHKGNVARAMFYFSVRYQIPIDPDQEFFLRQWHEEDPVDELERNRHEMIYQFQKNRNPFIDHPELVSKIKDF
jgi:deoxyribonuclease I